MTDTDTPRTTAPAMEERHLWAQSILDGDYGTLGQRPFLYRDALADAHADRAALRDRLAWAEERERVLTDALREFEWSDEDTILAVGRCPYCSNLELFGHTPDCAFAALIATPTDGAVPPRHNGEGDD
jgi:hypothetical protein